MKVSELINKLKEFPADAEVLVDCDDGYDIQPVDFRYYSKYYPTDFERMYHINELENVVVHHC